MNAYNTLVARMLTHMAVGYRSLRWLMWGPRRVAVAIDWDETLHLTERTFVLTRWFLGKYLLRFFGQVETFDSITSLFDAIDGPRARLTLARERRPLSMVLTFDALLERHPDAVQPCHHQRIRNAVLAIGYTLDEIFRDAPPPLADGARELLQSLSGHEVYIHTSGTVQRQSLLISNSGISSHVHAITISPRKTAEAWQVFLQIHDLRPDRDLLFVIGNDPERDISYACGAGIRPSCAFWLHHHRQLNDGESTLYAAHRIDRLLDAIPVIQATVKRETCLSQRLLHNFRQLCRVTTSISRRAIATTSENNRLSLLAEPAESTRAQQLRGVDWVR